jgi:Protein of unknown function (DUF1592)/Protein of unknown function (DUF1588)/Protein of unknown function (DUF1587)/Protein of unknown function (DUF1585)/Protein of unknown function (DUF1595)
MKISRSRILQNRRPWRKLTLAGLFVLLWVVDARPNPLPTFKQYCFQCHGNAGSMAGVNLEQMTSQGSISESFKQWRNVAVVLEQKSMPPEMMPQPAEEERRAAISWIRAELDRYAKKHAGDPGRVTVRRLTSGEYGYSIQDLTGLDLKVEHDLVADEVGGEGFSNFGDVQFIQDAGMERYLEAAKRVADHAVIGSGPIQFFADPGKTGFELSAIARIRAIYDKYGFRTVSGEGGRPYGLDAYGKALYAAWRYQHRAAFGESNIALKDLAAREGVTSRFAQHIWTVLNQPSLSYPSAEVVARWRKLPLPGADPKASAATVRASCEEIQKFLVTWPSWLFARGDLAAGGAGDERPLEFSDASLKVETRRRLSFFRGFRGGPRGPALPTGGTARIYLNAVLVNPDPKFKPVIVWRNPTIQFRKGFGRPGQTPATPAVAGQPGANPQPESRPMRGGENLPRLPLSAVVTDESVKKLGFGQSPDNSVMGPEDFASEGSTSFEVKVPDGLSLFELQVEAEVGSDRNQVFRITISDREDGSTRRVPVWGLAGDPQSAGYKAWKASVLEFARILPPNSHGEPTPADKDPIPAPFDNTYNVPEHDDFVVKVKYIRDDRFVVEHILDETTRVKLDQAWNDLYASFEYHDNYLRLLANKFKVDLKGKHISDFDAARTATLPDEMRQYVRPLRTEYQRVMATQAAARAGHVGDCVQFASRAWRRPLAEGEKLKLRSFYSSTVNSELDHRKAIRALLARILVAPAFLYRVEPAQLSAVRPLSGWELAGRLSYFLWSSVPDEELRRAAGAGELNTPAQLQRQVKRMLADPKARRFSTEFFGQWLGFYRFDQYRGVDTSRFPEFTDEVKGAMYDEAVSFFEHVIRKDRPIREMLQADYTFLNQALAKHYGVQKEITSKDQMERVDGANAFHRGGLLRLGAVLTATSAPLRTSPVKRGDWVLRRVLGTAIPPPPADAGSIPADEKLFGGLTLREKLAAHQRNATCAGCHSRIDPLGFPLEKYDAIGRAREQYPDGKPIDDSGVLANQKRLSGVDGLLDYLKGEEQQVVRTLAQKLLGYALGRTILLSDQPLIDRLANAGGEASISKLAAEIAASPQFRNRRGLEDSPALETRKSTTSLVARKSNSTGGE